MVLVRKVALGAGFSEIQMKGGGVAVLSKEFQEVNLISSLSTNTK
jgi:hypothetical protein